MFTLGDVADILDSALDTGISIVDTLAKLSDIADEGKVNRQKCYEVLEIEDQFHKNVDINENIKPQFINGNRENTAFNSYETDVVAAEPLAIHDDNRCENKRLQISLDKRKPNEYDIQHVEGHYHSLTQASVGDEIKKCNRYERSGTFVLDQSPIKSAQEATLQGIPIIEALGDLCVVADNFLKDYKEPDCMSQLGEQQEKPERESQQPGWKIVLENEINSKVNEILESFQKLDSTVDTLKKEALERFTENSSSDDKNGLLLDGRDIKGDTKQHYSAKDSLTSRRNKSPRPKTFLLHEVLTFPKHNETLNVEELSDHYPSFDKNNFNQPITDDYIESQLSSHTSLSSHTPTNEEKTLNNDSNERNYSQEEVATCKRQPKKYGSQPNRSTYILSQTFDHMEDFMQPRLRAYEVVRNEEEYTKVGHENKNDIGSVDSLCLSEHNTAKFKVTSSNNYSKVTSSHNYAKFIDSIDDSAPLSQLFRSSSYSHLPNGESTLFSKLRNQQKSVLLSQSLSDFDNYTNSDELPHKGFLGDRTLSQPILSEVSPTLERENNRKTSVGNVVNKLGMLHKVMSTSLSKLTELHAVKRQISISTNSLDEQNTTLPAAISKTAYSLRDEDSWCNDTCNVSPTLQHSSWSTSERYYAEQETSPVDIGRQVSNSRCDTTHTLTSPPSRILETLSSPPYIVENDSSLLLIDEKESDDDETSEKVFIHTFTRQDIYDNVPRNDELDAELSNVEDIIRNLECQWSEKIKNVFDGEAQDINEKKEYLNHDHTSPKTVDSKKRDDSDDMYFGEVSSHTTIHDLSNDKDGISAAYKEENFQSPVKLREKKGALAPKRTGTYILDRESRNKSNENFNGRSSSYDADGEEGQTLVLRDPSARKKKQRVGTYVLDSPNRYKSRCVEIDFEDDLGDTGDKSSKKNFVVYSKSSKKSTSESFSTEEEEFAGNTRHSDEESRRTNSPSQRGRTTNVSSRKSSTYSNLKFGERSTSPPSNSRKSSSKTRPNSVESRRVTRSSSGSPLSKTLNRPPSLGKKSSSFTEGECRDYTSWNSKRAKNIVSTKKKVKTSNSPNNTMNHSTGVSQQTKDFLKRSISKKTPNPSTNGRKTSTDVSKDLSNSRTRSQTVQEKEICSPKKTRSRSVGDNKDKCNRLVNKKNPRKPAAQKDEKRNSQEFVPLHERTPKTSPVHTNFLRRSRPSFRSHNENLNKDGVVNEQLTERLTVLRMKLEEKRQRFEEEKKRQQALWNQERAKILQDAFFVMITDNENKQPLVPSNDDVIGVPPSCNQSATWEVHFEKNEQPLEDKGANEEKKKLSKLSPREYLRQKQEQKMDGGQSCTPKQGLWFVGLSDAESDKYEETGGGNSQNNSRLERKQQSADDVRQPIKNEKLTSDQLAPSHQTLENMEIDTMNIEKESTLQSGNEVPELGTVLETNLRQDNCSVNEQTHHPTNSAVLITTDEPAAHVIATDLNVIATDLNGSATDLNGSVTDLNGSVTDLNVIVTDPIVSVPSEIYSQTGKSVPDEHENKSSENESSKTTQQPVEVNDTPIYDDNHGHTNPSMLSSTVPETDQVVLKPPVNSSSTPWSHQPEIGEDPVLFHSSSQNDTETHISHVINGIQVTAHDQEQQHVNDDSSVLVSMNGTATTSLEQRLEDFTISDVNSSDQTYMTSTPMKLAVPHEHREQQQSAEKSDASQSETSATTPQGTSWGFTFGDEFLESSGMTPKQERQKARFLKNRTKKLEEGKQRKEAELEKKRKKEEKLAEQRAKEEEEEKLRCERLIEQQLKDVTSQLHQETFTKRIHELTYNVDLKPTPEKLEQPRYVSRKAPTPSPLIRRVKSPDMSEEAGSNHFAEYKGPAAYQKPSGKSNRKIMQNAITHCCLCGEVNKDAKQKCLQAISQSDASHFLVLFREGLKFRSVYEYRPENETVTRIYGIGPKNITPKMQSCFFKYNSGGKEFNSLETKHLSIQVDGLMIKKELWEKKAGQTSKGNSSTKKKQTSGNVRPQSTR